MTTIVIIAQAAFLCKGKCTKINAGLSVHFCHLVKRSLKKGVSAVKPERRKAVFCALGGICLLLPALRGAVLPFLLALFLAGCLQRTLEKMAEHGLPRPLGAVLVMGALLLPAALLLCGGAFVLARGGYQLLKEGLPLLGQQSMDDWLYRLLTALPPAVREAASTGLTLLEEQKTQLAARALAWLAEQNSGWVTALPGQLWRTALWLLLFLFCLIEYPQLRALACSLLPRDWQGGLVRARRALSLRLGQWLHAESRLVGLIFGELALGLTLLRIPHALWLGALIALIDLLPMVGSGLVLLPWAALRWLTEGRAAALGLALLWLAVWLTRTLLEPKLVGRHLQIPTALSFFAALLGAKLWGIKGFILCPVLAAAALELCSSKQNGAPD